MTILGNDLKAADENVPQWVAKAPMKDKRTRFGAAVVNGLIYVFGGVREHASDYLDSLEIYNPETNLWTLGKPMPNARSFVASAALEGKIYAIGGNDFSNEVMIYDVETDRWTIGAPMPTGRTSHKAVSMGGKVYVMGGYGTSGNSNLNVVEIYDPKTDTWETGTPLPLRLRDFTAVVLNDKIYLMGGEYRTLDKENFFLDKILIYDAKTKIWTEGPSAPQEINKATASVVGDCIYLMGGNNNTSGFNQLNIFNSVSNTWSKGPNMIDNRSGHSSVSINQTIYAIGGSVYGGRINEMEALDVSKMKASSKLAVYLNQEETVQLSVSKNLADNAMLSWTSSSEAVATVDANGLATAVAPGLSDISAKNADGTFEQFIPVRVFPGTADLFRLAVHLAPGQSKQLGMTEDVEGVTWKSMDEAVVTVDANGKITAVATGLAIIEATVGSDVQHIYARVKADV